MGQVEVPMGQVNVIGSLPRLASNVFEPMLHPDDNYPVLVAAWHYNLTQPEKQASQQPAGFHLLGALCVDERYALNGKCWGVLDHPN